MIITPADSKLQEMTGLNAEELGWLKVEAGNLVDEVKTPAMGGRPPQPFVALLAVNYAMHLIAVEIGMEDAQLVELLAETGDTLQDMAKYQFDSAMRDAENAPADGVVMN